jgi:hypothetical protein
MDDRRSDELAINDAAYWAVVEACEEIGHSEREALDFADAVEGCVRRYFAHPADQKSRQEQKHLALNIHRNSTKALRLLDRRIRRPKDIRAHVDAVARDVLALHELGRGCHRYVSMPMRFDVTDETVRWATGRPPRKNGPGHPDGRCMDEWPDGSPNTVDPWMVFACASPARPEQLDPRRYSGPALVGLLQLFQARFSPQSPALIRMRGHPAHLAEERLVDDLCRYYEVWMGGHPHSRNVRWMRLVGVILEVYGLDHISLDYRVKRYDKLRARQRQLGRRGRSSLPRYIVSEPSSRRWVLENSLFVWGDSSSA